MAPLALDIGPSELLIILAVVLVLFGGSRLAGLGKSAGRAIKEFKDETGTLTDEPASAEPAAASNSTSRITAAAVPADAAKPATSAGVPPTAEGQHPVAQ